VLKIKQYSGINIRPRTVDWWTVNETFYEHMYLPLCDVQDVKVVVDLGADIGDSAVFFAQSYPRAKIIAVECNPDVFEVLESNLRAYPNIVLVKTAICSEPPVAPCMAAFPEKMTMKQMMEKLNIEHIDILKMDIIGGERFLFENDCSWLAKVDRIGCKLFDNRYPGCSTAFFAALSTYFGGVYWLFVQEDTDTFYIKRDFRVKGMKK
jgi:hypothetical protein